MIGHYTTGLHAGITSRYTIALPFPSFGWCETTYRNLPVVTRRDWVESFVWLLFSTVPID